MIARTSFQLLLLLNLALAGLWLAPGLGFDPIGGGGREPERLASQLHPEQVRLIGEPVAPSSVPPAGAAAMSGAAESAPLPASAAGSAPVATSGAAASCLQWSALMPEQVTAINAAVRAAGAGVALREESQSSNSYWINIPPLGGRPGAEKRVADLRQMGLQDLFVVKDAGADQWAISLGLYRNEGVANRFFEGLQKRGIRNVRITVRENPSSRVRLSGPAEQIQRIAQGLAETLKNNDQTACAPN